MQCFSISLLCGIVCYSILWNSFIFASVQTNTATKSIVLNCSEIVVNDVQFKGKDQCAFVYSVYFMFFLLTFSVMILDSRLIFVSYFSHCMYVFTVSYSSVAIQYQLFFAWLIIQFWSLFTALNVLRIWIWRLCLNRACIYLQHLIREFRFHIQKKLKQSLSHFQKNWRLL